jgi:demethylmenaquinone methyltransferase/2-methoxy-6-polyprenyl-1,4-benzoquinol methylase
MSTLTPDETMPQAASRAQQVQQMFNRIAPRYDLLNDCISFGMHRLWKGHACAKLNLPPGGQVLDVCCGTGDLTRYLLKHVGDTGHVTGLDFSEQMLAVARQRFAALANVRFLQGDAMAIPLEENRFDGAIVSFGLRNVTDITQTLAEMTRVVKPGGWVVNLDTAPNPKMPGYWFYFSQVMPRLGRLVSQDRGAYRYLSESTRQFLEPAELAERFRQVGLTRITCETLSMGSVSIQAGQKPL